ncbi:MAG: RluA family pseudouridine synthase [Hyphomicrobiaceae bacterium]|nr:RluA family pseudouridine synthase [Hyphomicrobiaceae bacterium]
MHAVEELTGPVTLTVPPEDAGQRLDRWLAGQLPQLSRARLQTLIREGAVTSGRETIGDGNLRVKPGEVYRFVPPEPEPSDVAGENIALDIVYEDADVIVIDKPAGLVVHPAAGHASGTLVNALVAHCGDSLSGIGGIKRPGIVHRLDKDTSGLLVVAKNDAAHQSLSEQFKSHGADGRLERVYKALVWGQLQRAEGTIDAPLARSTSNRQKISVTRGESGRHAITHYRVLETFAGGRGGVEVSLVELRLETGRTHQIRVHLAHIGHPVLGDATYGAGFKTRAAVLDQGARAALEDLGRQALHAASLAFEHPRKRKQMVFQSEFPEDIQRLVDRLRGGAPEPASGKARRAQAKPDAAARGPKKR